MVSGAGSGVAPPGIARQIVAEGGRVTFARFMALALTLAGEGYYTGNETFLGPRGHFSTAPVLSPEFNDTVARLVHELVLGLATEGAADPDGDQGRIHLLELGGGEGQLAAAVLGRLAVESPELKRAVTFTVVEVGEALRARQREALTRLIAQGWRVEWASTLGSAVGSGGEARGGGRGGGPTPTVVMTNEFVDALPVHLLDVSGDVALEAWVQVVDGSSLQLKEVWGEPSGEAVAELRTVFGTEDLSVVRPLSQDGFIELRPGVHELLRGDAARCLLTIDYGDWSGAPGTGHRRTLRGYFRHQMVDDLYARVGAQDLTADVDFCALDIHGRKAGFETVLYTTVAAMLRGDSGEERLGLLEQQAISSLEADRRASALRSLMDGQGVGGAFKVMLQVRG